ncbi:hypothetical protein [Paenibacillus sp. 1P07SE]|uniref:hypothetical protein n=1 Tax=Paenibacillus sp. 1P07SE TaxID=3132209 RepID=UPI0039A4C89C
MKQTRSPHGSETIDTDIDWAEWLTSDMPAPKEAMQRQELAERRQDLEELAWLLTGAWSRLALFNETYPDERFEQELGSVFRRQAEELGRRLEGCAADLKGCDFDSYLALKYDIRMLLKQLGAVIEGSDWQSPCKRLGGGAQAAAELGYAQKEENTYERSYGSDAVKSYEQLALKAWYGIEGSLGRTSLGYLTTSGMKALELALFACRGAVVQSLPFYFQEGFYGEGADLAKLIINDVQELTPEAIYARLESGQRIGGLLIDPGVSWPARPPVDLERLMSLLSRHTQCDPLYVIVDRTHTSIANPLFTRYAEKLPPHIVLVSIESGIKYLQYGLDLANSGFLAATGSRLEQEGERQRWIDLLALLDAGAAPLTVRQLPEPDRARLAARLARVNRNAGLLRGFLEHQLRQGRIVGYQSSVPPSEAYMLEGDPWRGAVCYIRLADCETEEQVQRRIDDFVAAAPGRSHFVSGGSFGFDTFRMNAVSDKEGKAAALRISVGRDPILQLLGKLRYVDRELLG